MVANGVTYGNKMIVASGLAYESHISLPHLVITTAVGAGQGPGQGP